jgi:hypothetical protein
MDSPNDGQLSPGALRMRRHRKRRRDGLRCVTIQLRDSEIADLIHKRLLKAEDQSNRAAIVKCIGRRQSRGEPNRAPVRYREPVRPR